MTGWLRALPGLVILSVASFGCETFTGVDFGEVESLDGLCTPDKPPPRPELSGAGGDLERTVVLVDYDFGDGELEDGTPEYLTVGYDFEDPPE